MSEKLNNKQDGAIRLFEALSGVDEKYLAACEDYKKAKSNGLLIFVQKYGKGIAAVLCLALLGAGYVGMQQFASLDGPAAADFAMNAVTASQECCEAPAEMQMEENVQEENAVPESAKTEMNLQSDSVAEGFLKHEQDCVDAGASFDEELSLEEAKGIAVIGEYIPECWPEDGAFVKIIGSQESGAEYVKLFWTYNNMQDEFVVKVENLGDALPDRVQEEIAQEHIVYEEQLSKELIVLNSQESSENEINADAVDVDFGVLHKADTQYVLVQFEGRSTVDEIWDLLQCE